MSVLKFDVMDSGEWEAYSAINDDGSSFEWRIRVTDDGMFSVASSDKELLDSVPPNFSTFADAVEWCESHEKTMTIDQMCQTKPPQEFHLGAYQQAWHMANSACNALGLEYEHTSPHDIATAICALRTGA